MKKLINNYFTYQDKDNFIITPERFYLVYMIKNASIVLPFKSCIINVFNHYLFNYKLALLIHLSTFHMSCPIPF